MTTGKGDRKTQRRVCTLACKLPIGAKNYGLYSNRTVAPGIPHSRASPKREPILYSAVFSQPRSSALQTKMLVVLNSAQTEHPLPGTRYSTALLLLVLCILAVAGCVRRRLFINSNPVGAVVYVDNEQIGTTPCAVDFTYYGTREIRLVKPGFETLKVNQPIPTPWYEYTPIDFISENLLPYEVRDNRSVSFNMMPEIIIPSQELIDRGNQLRQETLQGTAIPCLATGPTETVVPSTPLGQQSTPPFGVTPLEIPSQDQLPVSGTPPPVVLPAPPGPLLPTAPAGPAILPQPNPSPPRGRPLVSPPLR